MTVGLLHQINYPALAKVFWVLNQNSTTPVLIGYFSGSRSDGQTLGTFQG